MPESLAQHRIADQYTSLLHVSGGSIDSWKDVPVLGYPGVYEAARVYDGAGSTTGLSLSSLGDRVVINNYVQPDGWDTEKDWLDAFFPIDSIMITTNFRNPEEGIPDTKWILVSEGTFPVGVGTATDKNDSTFTFTAGNAERDIQSISNGDIAGEYRSGIYREDLPTHSHSTNLRTEEVPRALNGQGTNVGFIFYFGDIINSRQLTGEDQRYLDADLITAFQNNTEYGDAEHYRDFIIKQNHDKGKVYKDADFDPKFGGQTLEGWAPPAAGGPGWGGRLNTSGRFIGNSPRPVEVPWEYNGNTFFITKATYDPRSGDRVHPGRFPDAELIKARDFIIHVLGVEEAAKALAGVNRLKELNATVEQAVAGDNTYYGMVPGGKITESTTAGQSVRHNNIPPNYPVYFWRRVPLTYTANIAPDTRARENLPYQFNIQENKRSIRGDVFNLNEWAVGKGWDGQTRIKITVDSGVYIYSDDPNDNKVPAMIIDEFPGGLELVNNGFIMGRGGNGGSYYSDPYRHGQDGGDAIHIIGNSEITIKNNTGGGIAGGGGGGAASNDGESGGGGGAGGGWGGTSGIHGIKRSLYVNDGDGHLGRYDRHSGQNAPTTAGGGRGGDPGQPGGHGRYYQRMVSQQSLQEFKAAGDIVTVGWGPRYVILPGIGGEAGGSGAGGQSWSGTDDQGTGGGGGRILSPTAYGGGTGGVFGAPFGALDAGGNLKEGGREFGPAWSNTSPADNGSVETICTGRGRNRRCRFVYKTAYNQSNPYLGWLSGDPLNSSGVYGNGTRGSSRNLGPHWRANNVIDGTPGLPFVVAHVNSPSSDYDGLSYLSPTGWDGYTHRSALLRGGSGALPGVFQPYPSTGPYKYVSARRNGRKGLRSDRWYEEYGSGGGGWGAPGGAPAWLPLCAGKGGLSIRASAGQVLVSGGGVLYGRTDGNVNRVLE